MATIRNLFLIILLLIPLNAFATFTFDESQNKVVVTAGTVGTPLTFSDFVTADRAGTAELTPEDAPVAFTQASTISLTFAVRPVEDLAVTLTFTISGSAGLGAGDTIDLSGDDWDGNNQTESIVIAGGDAAYPSTKKYSTIDAAGITFTDNAGGGFSGNLKVTQGSWGVIWDFGNGQYRIDANVDFGNIGVTTTHFRSRDQEMVFWTTGTKFIVEDDATVTIGDIEDDWGHRGSFWSEGSPVHTVLNNGNAGTLNIYGSMFHLNSSGRTTFAGGTFTAKNAILSATFDHGAGGRFDWTTNVTANFEKVFVYDVELLLLQIIPNTFTDVHLHSSDGLRSQAAGVIVIGSLVTTFDFDYQTRGATATLTVIDPEVSVTSPKNELAGGFIEEQYTVNIHVVDKDGTNINIANVTCNDTNGTSIFDVNTDANGDIAEQTVDYKIWETTAETETDFSPHTFSISKAGFRSAEIIYNFSDGTVNWEVVLMDGDTVIYDSTIFDSTIF